MSQFSWRMSFADGALEIARDAMEVEVTLVESVGDSLENCGQSELASKSLLTSRLPRKFVDRQEFRSPWAGH